MSSFVGKSANVHGPGRAGAEEGARQSGADSAAQSDQRCANARCLLQMLTESGESYVQFR